MPRTDWLDEADGVFRGGGVKGLGLAGALLGFAEHADRPVRRWVNVAGASAGAIIACWLAVKGDDAVPSLERLLRETDFAQFEDFGPPGDRLVGGTVNLALHHGLAHGEAFREWFDEQLGGATFARVRASDGEGWTLKLVAVDVTAQQLLLLPDDLPRYRERPDGAAIDPDAFSIARAARMSMSIPYFFEPVELFRDRVRCEDSGQTRFARGERVDRVDAEEADRRCRAAGRRPGTWSEVPAEPSLIIDGGTLSNFPVWVFDVDPAEAGRGPRRMTFGFTLTGGRGLVPDRAALARLLPWGATFGIDIFRTAQSAWDTRFASHSTRVRTIAVDAGTIATTDFSLGQADKDLLVGSGRTAAMRFLDGFDPSQYRNTYGAGIEGVTSATAPTAATAPGS